MNERGVIRCTCSLTLVGTSLVSGTFTPTPPKNGKIIRLEVVYTAPATEISDLIIREGLAGDVRISYANETDNFVDAPGATPYSSTELTAQASTDDGTSASNVEVTLDIEVI